LSLHPANYISDEDIVTSCHQHMNRSRKRSSEW